MYLLEGTPRWDPLDETVCWAPTLWETMEGTPRRDPMDGRLELARLSKTPWKGTPIWTPWKGPPSVLPLWNPPDGTPWRPS